MTHKSGFVNIIGNPNVGKSTLMNALMGEKISIITHKVQTTRHRIMGIFSGDNFQIVFSDTPGILKPNYLMQNYMLAFVEQAIDDADMFLLVSDVKETFEHKEIVEKIVRSQKPILILINKIDLSNQADVETKVNEWKSRIEHAQILPISALHDFNIKEVMNIIIDKLPENPPYFPKDEVSDRPVKFFVSEIIREKILIQYQKEIPYCSEVVIDSFKEDETIVRILTTIYVMRESQKAIILGHKGEAIRNMGTRARIDIEKMLDKKVYLELFVKVSPDWRNNKLKLKGFGYTE